MTAHTPRSKNLALAHPKDGTVMKVFLTGATGYVGSAVLARLVTDGHELVAHARSVESGTDCCQEQSRRSVTSPTPDDCANTSTTATG